MSENKCAIARCGGDAVQIENIFLHTLGSNPKITPDFSLFVECRAWRCIECGYIQLFSNGEVIKVPSGA